MFFVKKRAILYLKRAGFQLYSKDIAEALSLNFQPDAVEDLEVIDVNKLEDQLRTFIKDKAIRPHDLIIVLSDEVFFQKEIYKINETEKQEEIQNFLDEIPLDPAKIGKLILKFDNKLLILATNKNLYFLLKNFFEKHNWQVSAVTPITIFGKLGISDISGHQEAKQIARSSELIKSANFITEESSMDSQNVEKTRDKKTILKKQFSLLLIGVVFIILTGVIVLFALGVVKNPFKKAEEQQAAKVEDTPAIISPKPTPEPESTGSAEIGEGSDSQDVSYIDKDELRIKILNGTGTAGQAAKLRDQLNSLGFRNFEIGNAGSFDISKSLISFSTKVSPEIRNQLISELKRIFTEVSEEDDNELEEFDILITTGKDLTE